MTSQLRKKKNPRWKGKMRAEVAEQAEDVEDAELRMEVEKQGGKESRKVNSEEENSSPKAKKRKQRKREATGRETSNSKECLTGRKNEKK